jgi:hypothetical protein
MDDERAAERAQVRAGYLELRAAIDAGTRRWTDLAEIFTDDAVYVDAAWGRIQGIDEIRRFLDESMRGFEDWRFPVTAAAWDGDHLLVRWTQIMSSGHQQSGYSTLRYAGGGRFDYEEDLLNMVHVVDDLRAAGWRPGADFVAPPGAPDRDFSEP